MTKLIRVGFFREMRHGEPSDPSLTEARAPAPAPQQDKLAAYLAAGHVYIATPGMAKDVIDRKTVIGPPNYLTDGEYVWPGDAAYYVRTYNARLPTAFVEHVVARGFQVPPGVDLATLEL
jgi:hypothetical protein